MESNYNNENFERLLKESSEQYRMYPSESVWRNVYNTLHTKRRWFGIGLILLLSAGFVTTFMMTNSGSGSHLTGTQKIQASPMEKTEADRNIGELLLAPTRDNLSTPAITGDRITFYHPESFSVDETSNRFTDFVPTIPIYRSSNTFDGGPNSTITDSRLTIETMPQLVNDVFAPIALVIADPVTDQDNWISRGGRFLNNEMAPKKIRYNSTVYYPLSIESVINSYTRRNKKLSFQFYFTPTISYRKLSENKSYTRTGSSTTPSIYGNINNVVTHKPDMGIELGVAARYALGKKVRLRGGLQFNTSRYDIKAFSYSTEVTTIALNSGTYIADSLSTTSSYRNFNGYKSDWLHNFYFQISAPVGIELRLAGDDKIQFGIGSTIQPTYILGDRAYLLSSNYKNYAEVPQLMRRWNVNASFEAFVSYSTGKMNWQVGPQIRYQLQSSFVKEYPVKENLFDFGLKIGVSANK